MKRNFKQISKIYRDKDTDLFIEVLDALDRKEITPEQYKLIVGVMLKRKINEFVRGSINSLKLGADHDKENTLMYINYTKKLLSYGK